MSLEPWNVEIREKTLWDEYAMAALTGLLANRCITKICVYKAIQIADDMMEKRKGMKK